MIVRKAIEATNKQDLSAVDVLYAPDFVDHTLETRGLESVKQFITSLFTGFPDFHAAIEDIIAEGDKVCVRIRNTMTNTGEYYGLAPTGKKITVRGVNIFRIVGSRIVEGWGTYNFHRDDLNFFMQLGLVELTEKGKKLLTS